MKTIGLYVHIPFCVHKCAYCDFYSLGGVKAEGYAFPMMKHIRAQSDFFNEMVGDTVYIGGGTPSLLSAEDMKIIMDALRTYVGITDDAEVSMEANPGTLTKEKLEGYKACGINRLSIGLQSANDDELRCLSRIHNLEEFEKSYELAREVGFNNINIDLMYGLPNQKEETLYKSIEYVISKNPEHISFYGLKIEPNTPFGQNPKIEQMLPDADRQADMYIKACEMLEASGYIQYEISNFAKPGYECKHNLKYWKSQDFAGFGPAAYTIIGNRLYSFKKDAIEFMTNPEYPDNIRENFHFAPVGELLPQYVMLAFRLTEGVDANDFKITFGYDFDEMYFDKIKKYINLGHIQKTEKGYRLSRKGMLISNYILSDILDFD